MDIFLSLPVLLPRQLPLLPMSEVIPDNTNNLIFLGLIQNPTLITIMRESITICSITAIHLLHKDFVLFRGLYEVTNICTDVVYVN